MKRLFPLLFIMLTCSVGFTLANPPMAINNSSIKPDERTVKDFNGVVAGGPINVIIQLGDKESLRFEGDADAIATLVSEVRGSTLVIRPQTSWVSWAKKYENKKIIAYVTAKKISSLTMSGNGSINVSGLITGSELAVTLSGSGSIKANVDVSEITGVISGSGNLSLNGKANGADITLSGRGNLEGKALTVSNLSTRISGSGTINIIASEKISAMISGSGHVYYSGNPEVKETVIGSGGVSKM